MRGDEELCQKNVKNINKSTFVLLTKIIWTIIIYGGKVSKSFEMNAAVWGEAATKR